MKKKYYIGLDQGTTGTTTLLLDEKWNVVARGYKEHTQYYPKPGWVEHDPLELWQRVMESMSMALSEGGVSAEDVACIGIDNQGETVMLWDKITGAPVYNAIVWQDRRMARYADELTDRVWGTDPGKDRSDGRLLFQRSEDQMDHRQCRWCKGKNQGRSCPGRYSGFLAHLEDDTW